MSESSYKVYASEEYVDQRVPPSPDGTHKMLVTDADGNVCWEEKPFYQEVVTKEDRVVVTTSGVDAFYDDGYGYLLNKKRYIHEGAWFTFVVGDDSVSCAATDIPTNNYTNVAVGGINIEVQSRLTPKTGLYCLRLRSVYSGEVYISYNYPVVRQIEEIFVPDTIARISDIPAAVTDDHINELIDAKAELPAGSAARQMLVTDADGSLKWENRADWIAEEFSIVTDRYGPTGIGSYETNPTMYLMIDTNAVTNSHWVVKISNETPSLSEILATGEMSLTRKIQDYIPITADMILDDYQNGYAVLYDNKIVVAVVTNPEGGRVGGTAFYEPNASDALFYVDCPEPGLYLYVRSTKPAAIPQMYFKYTKTAKLDPKHLPEDHINSLIDSKLEAAHPTELITIPASAWTGTDAPYFAMNQACSIATMTNKLIVSLSPTLASDEDGLNEMLSTDTYNAIAKSKLMAVVQADGAITLAAYGKKPEIDIPVIVTEVG